MSTIIASLVSAGAIYLLIKADPKRNRVFNRTAKAILPRAVLWLAAVSPGPALVIAGQPSSFLCWLAAITVVGWLLAARRPQAG